ncbi:MAG: hypothetical protein NPIRA02_18490 [Nitrospirales bacterium]|nr:MAG: hypothetical protein NPIRA02_18490 [Nitrospirales bacterium]
MMNASPENLLATFKKEFLGCSAAKTSHTKHVFDATAMDVESMDDYQRILEMRAFYAQKGMCNPYFMPRQGVISDRVQVEGRDYISFSGYNYLGLSDHPTVIEAVKSAVTRYGTHAGAARMVGGQTELHREVEHAYAEAFGFDDCVMSVGGYAVNVMTVSYLLGANDLILMDDLMHNSGMMGAVMSQARRIVFPHNDYSALDRLLKEHRLNYRRAMILVEGAYSMDGDLVDLPALLTLKRQHHAWLMVDEAHSLGVVGKTGKGVCEHWGVPASEVDLIMGTLSKSFASCGGFLGGSRHMIDVLRHFAPGLLLYSTGLPPASAAAALAALTMMRTEPERITRLQHNVTRFVALARERGFDVGQAGQSAVVPIHLGDTRLALHLMSELLKVGIIVHAVMYPIVPQGQARLRFFLTVQHTEAQFVHTLDQLRECLDRYRSESSVPDQR